AVTHDAMRNAPGQLNRSISHPNARGVTAIPTRADPFTRPLVHDRLPRGTQWPTPAAQAGWRGEETAPIRPRTKSKAVNAVDASRAARPTTPVSATKNADPKPPAINATRG